MKGKEKVTSKGVNPWKLPFLYGDEKSNQKMVSIQRKRIK